LNLQVTTETIDFWFDAACPFAWLTSRWVDEVAAQRPVEVRWHPMSLAMVNEDEDLSEEYRAFLVGAARSPRVALVIGRDHGNDALGRYYAAIGTRVHAEKREFTRELVEEALAEAGLPLAIADALDDESLDSHVRVIHDKGQAAVGHKSGTPVVVLDGGHGFFGPVVSVLPRGDDALRLYDGLRLVQSVDSFAELKRSRDDLVLS
jgi:hypothetical protein